MRGEGSTSIIAQLTRQTRYTDPMLVQCWASVSDDSATLNFQSNKYVRRFIKMERKKIHQNISDNERGGCFNQYDVLWYFL